MKSKFTLAGIAAALVMISGCANQKHWTSEVGADTPVTAGGVRVANENPGSQGPVADNSRLAINHRDVARREALARERLARDAEARRRTQVTDNTYTRSSAPETTPAPVKETTKVTKAKNATRTAKHHRAMGTTPAKRSAHNSPRRSAITAPGVVRDMNREVALNELHHINQKEIALAKLAATQARSDEIRSSAARIQRDHEALETRVEELAKARQISLAKFTPATHEEVRMNALEKLSGANFDYAFAETMKDGHKLTTAELKILRARAADPEVVALIDQALPKVQSHEQHSGNLLSSIKTGQDVSARR